MTRQTTAIHYAVPELDDEGNLITPPMCIRCGVAIELQSEGMIGWKHVEPKGTTNVDASQH